MIHIVKTALTAVKFSSLPNGMLTVHQFITFHAGNQRNVLTKNTCSDGGKKIFVEKEHTMVKNLITLSSLKKPQN
jgi:hypothetical protein